MNDRFFEQPVLNSPYEYPNKHWELDEQGQPTQNIIEERLRAEFFTPIPKPKKRKKKEDFQDLLYQEGVELSSGDEQRYDPTSLINSIRKEVYQWKLLPQHLWKVTPETARLLQHWRYHKFSSFRPFFCQIEAVETLIWLTEVVPKGNKNNKYFLEQITLANQEANPELLRTALKLAIGSGKTTVMAMIIAWQTINAIRRPNSSKFTRGFVVVTPGITIRDRLRVLQPNDPDSYYQSRELIPPDMYGNIERAKIVITNYHAFKLRERIDLSKGGRSLFRIRSPI